LQTRVSFGVLVEVFNALVERVRVQSSIPSRPSPLRKQRSGGATSPAAAAVKAAEVGGALLISPVRTSRWPGCGWGAGSSSSADAGLGSGCDGTALSTPGEERRSTGGSAAYLVTGAASMDLNGVYSQSGESHGVPKYSNGRFTLLRRATSGGGSSCWYLEGASAPSPEPAEGGAGSGRCFYFLRSAAGTPPPEAQQWERGRYGLLPGPAVTAVHTACHCLPASVLAPAGAYDVGDYVRANWAARGVLYPGEVLAVNREDDSFDVLYDDGDFEPHVPRERLHPVAIELTDAFHAFAVGDVVKADLRGHGSWYTGRVVAVDTPFRVFTVKYDNGHLEKHVPPSRVQPVSQGNVKSDYASGERVRANWQGCGTWCLGRISAVHRAEGTFDVVYDDGEVEAHVAAHRLQVAELYAEPRVKSAESAGPSVDSLPFACTIGSKAAAAGGSITGAQHQGWG